MSKNKGPFPERAEFIAVERELGSLRGITDQDKENIASILQRYENDREWSKSSTGYEEIERDAAAFGYDRFTVRKISLLLGYDGRFERLIEKLNKDEAKRNS
ncbi:hypothetical protein [Saccharibacillus alkalitolerans]|uniref:Uncharacterized protein n=1 Tax=Saccharibacillus alkalitolerans TaxID=2705290 RepID=A0ABX0EYU6_9BACL|nr:hypothetical protein [Saccharibacillus alkalitolerans]NGZ73911.1 hypothetical protein [Saccharibacillus alkalitolerans]